MCIYIYIYIYIYTHVPRSRPVKMELDFNRSALSLPKAWLAPNLPARS